LELLLASAGITNATIQAALKVTDDGVEVVSEGHWRLFER
jgi:hypothetical protein